nr:ATP-binding protein [Butyrivibrio sp.]
YKIGKESIEVVNQKYHDLKHQIAVLRSQSDPDKRNAYLDKMEEDIRSYEAQNKTGNAVLDIILTTKALQCQKDSIQMSVVADGKLLNSIDEIDISTIFGNAIDNAIEGVKKIEDKEKRLIYVTVSAQKGFTHIVVRNCFEGELKIVNGLPKTTKKHKEYHGFGIKGIKETVLKYDGSTIIKADNGWFELRILIPN